MKSENKKTEFSSIIENLDYGFNIKHSDYPLSSKNIQASDSIISKSIKKSKKERKLFLIIFGCIFLAFTVGLVCFLAVALSRRLNNLSCFFNKKFKN